MKRLVPLVAVLLFTFTVAFAHGTAQHVIGTVTAVSDQALTVQGVDKKLTTVEITPETKFLKSGAAASVKDLKVGDRVVVEAGKVEGKEGAKFDAHEIRFGPTAAA